MSIDLHVLSNGRLRTILEWQNALCERRFELRLSIDTPMADVNGFLPAKLDDKNTGFECYHDDSGELMSVYRDVEFGRNWSAALGFRCVGDLLEVLAAWMAATAYAQAVRGVVFDPQEGKVHTPEEAYEVTRRIERDLPVVEQALQAFASTLDGRR